MILAELLCPSGTLNAAHTIVSTSITPTHLDSKAILSICVLLISEGLKALEERNRKER
jgi:hypothetical protein